MQQCTMNGDTFRRDDNGRLYLNGNEIIKNEIDGGGIFMLLSVGIIVGSLSTSVVYYILSLH